MRLSEIQAETYQGFWIEPNGNILSCNGEDVHHADIAIDEFDIEPNDDGDYDGYSRDSALEAAHDSGWMQVSNITGFLSIVWHGRATSAQAHIIGTELLRMAPTVKTYCYSHDGDYFDSRDFGDFLRIFMREMRKR